MKTFQPDYAEPTFEELVEAVMNDPAFHAAVGPTENSSAIARAALKAAFVYIALYAMVEEIQHETAGHA
jgi:hypothetical protein